MNSYLLSLLAIMGTGPAIAPFSPEALYDQSSPIQVIADSTMESENQDQTTEITGDLKASIYEQVKAQRSQLGLCKDEEDLTSDLSDINIYRRYESQYLVQVLCFNAAYQGVYEFVHGDLSSDPPIFERANTTLVGYPFFDLSTNVLSNSYKFIGAGTCYESSSYYWDGYGLRLVSSAIEDGIPNGCADLGVNVPDQNYLITANGIGPAKLGMTLQELKATLSPEDNLVPYQMGVDLPSGLMVQFYGEDQYALIFDNFDPDTWEELPITDASIIRGLVVRNPQYRTAEGVGPGTLLAKAAEYYGPPTLSYNWEIEGREYITFEQGLLGNDHDIPGVGISMRSNQGTITQFAGVYPEDIYSSSYQTTDRYHDHGAINSIEIMMDW